MDSLPPGDIERVEVDPAFEEFERRWARSEELHDVLDRLPGKLVLKSGMAGQRRKLLERWELIQLPGLDDDLPSSEVLDTLQKWIRDAEALIRYIVQIRGGREGQPTAAETKEKEDPPYELITSSHQIAAVTSSWYWPWEDVAIEKAEKKKPDLIKVAKYGAIGAGIIYAVAKWVEE